MAAAAEAYKEQPALEEEESLDGAEEEMLASQEEQLNPSTRLAIERVGTTYINWAKSHRWGPTNVKSLMKYVRYLSTQRSLAPTTINSTFSELLSFLERAPYSQHYSKTDLAAIYEYINAKLEAHSKKQALMLDEQQVIAYFKQAPNEGVHLRSKLIIIIIGIFTLARGQELAELRWEDVQESERYAGFEVTLHRKKTSASREVQHLLVPYDAFGLTFKDMLLAYKKLANPPSGPIWRSANGDPLSRTTIAEAPRHAAIFLGLPNAKKYTGHGLRAAGATTMANNGGTSVQLMMVGNWSSESAARGYLRESKTAMAETAAIINKQSVPVQTSASAPVPQAPAPATPVPPTGSSFPLAPLFSGCSFNAPISVVINHPH